MKTILLVAVSIAITAAMHAQNIDYTARITQFYGSNCGNDPGFLTTEEHTWLGWLSDDVNTVETYSGCIERNVNGAVTQAGTYANRTQGNTAATELRSRIDAWEDDMGSRCVFNTGFNSDDCRVNTVCNYPFNPVEYQFTTETNVCGSGDYNMNVWRQYRYATTTIADAVENNTYAYSVGGNRPFWGSRGSWASLGSDCATSGTITNNQTSSFSFTVSCVSQMTFRWRVSSEANYDYLRLFVNGVQQASISGNVGWTVSSVNLPTGGSNTIEFRYTKDLSVSSGLDRGFVDAIQFTSASNVVPGTVSGNTTVCEGQAIAAFSSLAPAQSYAPSFNYQWQISSNNATWSNIGGATGATYAPASLPSTYYYRRRVQDGCGLTNYSNTIVVTVNTASTPPALAAVVGTICPDETISLTAGGGTAGSGSAINWYTGPNGTGSWLGAGNSISVSPAATTTYYVRREGTCNTTADDAETVTVKDFVYGNDGELATSFCQDNSGWYHFYNGDRILLSVEGDLSGVPSPIVTINNNGGIYQAPNLPTDCGNNVNPGEESFEMARSWNFDPNGGTLNGTYNVRFYYQPSERTAVENAAIAWMAANPACNYSYKYPVPNGFFWFKNTGSNYTAPDYDGVQLPGSISSVNGANYTELTGVTSFSGGSGAVVLVPITGLPVTLSSFDAICEANENAIRVSWTSESESNASHYIVERSYDGNDWEFVRKLNAAGNSSASLNYDLVDTEVRNNQTTFYRLTQFDVDGASELLGIRSVSCESHEEGFGIYPNPVSEILTVSINGIASNRTIDLTIVDGKGQLVRRLTNVTATGNILSIDVSKLAPGFYLIQMSEGTMKLQTERFVKR